MSYRAEVLADSPLRYWRLGESAGTTAVDTMGVGDGTYSGGVTLSQPGALVVEPDTAVRLDGAQGKLLLPNVALTPPFTLETWVYIVGPGSVGATVYSTILGYAANRRLLIRNEAGSRFVLAQIGTNSLQTPVNSAPIGQWLHVVFVAEASNKSIYIQGVQEATGPTSGVTWNAAFLAGAYGNPSTNYSLDGYLDDIAIYGSALSPDRILAHYLAGAITPRIADLGSGPASVEVAEMLTAAEAAASETAAVVTPGATIGVVAPSVTQAVVAQSETTAVLLPSETTVELTEVR